MFKRIIVLMFAVLLVSLCATQAASPSPSSDSRWGHQLSMELRPNYIGVQHYYYSPENNPDGRRLSVALSAHVRYAFTLPADSTLGRLFPSTYHGVGVGVYEMFMPRSVGHPMVAYILQGGDIADVAPRLSLGYEWNLGCSWGWVANEAISTRWNVYINIALPLRWRVNNHWELTLTPDYTHFSNGDMRFSNSGANAVGLRLGASYHFSGEDVAAPAGMAYLRASEEVASKGWRKRLTTDVVLHAGCRGDRTIEEGNIYIIDKPLLLAGIQLTTLYQLNRYFSLGGSVDVLVDRSANLYNFVEDDAGNILSYDVPSLAEQTSAGVSLHGEIRHTFMALGIGVGCNFNLRGEDLSPIYTLFSLKAFVTKKMFLYIGYRYNSRNYTQGLTYGIGVRI